MLREFRAWCGESRWESNGGEDWKKKLLTYNLRGLCGAEKVTDVIYTIAAIPAQEKHHWYWVLKRFLFRWCRI